MAALSRSPSFTTLNASGTRDRSFVFIFQHSDDETKIQDLLMRDTETSSVK